MFSVYTNAKGYVIFYTEHPNETYDAATFKKNKGIVDITEGSYKLPAGKKELDEKYPLVVKANKACPIVSDFKDIYEQYRNSVAALVIINFVLIYSAFLHSVFRWSDEEESNRVKILTGTDIKLQGYKSNDALKVPQTDVEMNAQTIM